MNNIFKIRAIKLIFIGLKIVVMSVPICILPNVFVASVFASTTVETGVQVSTITPTTVPTAILTTVPTATPTTAALITTNLIPTSKPTAAIKTPIMVPSITQINPTTTTEVKLFDIVLTIESAVLNKASDLIARTQFTSFGNVSTIVDMNYRIEDTNSKVVFTENNKVTVETEKNVTKKFPNLNLSSGKYTLFLTTIYGNNVTDQFRQTFEVKKKTDILLIGRTVLLSLTMGVGWFFWFIYFRRKNI